MRADRRALEHAMNIIHTKEYRVAFGQYLRKGTPIRLSLKNEHPTPQYV